MNWIKKKFVVILTDLTQKTSIDLHVLIERGFIKRTTSNLYQYLQIKSKKIPKMLLFTTIEALQNIA